MLTFAFVLRPRTSLATPCRNEHTKQRKVGRKRGEELSKREGRDPCKSAWKPVFVTQSGGCQLVTLRVLLLTGDPGREKKERKEIKGKTLCFLVLNYQIFHPLPRENDLPGVRLCSSEAYRKMLPRKLFKKSSSSAVISQPSGKARRIFVTFALRRNSWLIKPFTFPVLCVT